MTQEMLIGKLLLAFTMAMILGCATLAQQIVFVDASLTTGDNDGTSWTNAHQGRLGLRDALANLPIGTPGAAQIWTADGTYAPDAAGGSRDAHFAMRNNLAIYGGFAGGEAALDERDPITNITILTGDLNDDDTPGEIYWGHQQDNATNVLRAIGVDDTALLDSVTITHGAAAGVGASNDEGANLRIENGSPTLQNCIFEAGYAERGGGGAAVLGGAPQFIDCTFRANIAPDWGGGAYNTDGGTATFLRCTFEANLGGSGAGLFNGRGTIVSSATVQDCTFRDNIGPIGAASGIGMFDWGGESNVERCTFINNKTVTGGGGIFLLGSHTRVRNCDFIDNEGTGDGGGAVYAQAMPFGSSSRSGTTVLTGELVNCRFVGNNGIIVANQQAQVDFINCTIVHNSLQDQFLIWPIVAVQGVGTNVRFRNSIIWGNGVKAFAKVGVVGGTGFIALGATIEMENSCVEHWDGSVPGNNNFEADPLFVDALGVDGLPGTLEDNVRVANNSLCVDAGDNVIVPVDVLTDLDERPRIIDSDSSGSAIVDLGAYERLRPGDLNADGIVNVFDLFLLLGGWGGDGEAATLASPFNIVDVFDLFVLLGNWG